MGARAEELDLPRPSYERIRELVHESRRMERRRPSTLVVLWETSMQMRPLEHAVDQLYGGRAPDYDEWKRRRLARK